MYLPAIGTAYYGYLIILCFQRWHHVHGIDNTLGALFNARLNPRTRLRNPIYIPALLNDLLVATRSPSARFRMPFRPRPNIDSISEWDILPRELRMRCKITTASSSLSKRFYSIGWLVNTLFTILGDMMTHDGDFNSVDAIANQPQMVPQHTLSQTFELHRQHIQPCLPAHMKPPSLNR